MDNQLLLHKIVDAVNRIIRKGIEHNDPTILIFITDLLLLISEEVQNNRNKIDD